MYSCTFRHNVIVHTHAHTDTTRLQRALDKKAELMPAVWAHKLELCVSDWGHQKDKYTDAYQSSRFNCLQTSYILGIFYTFALMLFSLANDILIS